MNKLLLDDNIEKVDDSENEDMDEEELINYKGYFANEEEPEERYFEYGAHFKYKTLYQKLDEIIKTLSPSRTEKEIVFKKITDTKINKDRNNVIKRQIESNNRIPINVTENKTLLKFNQKNTFTKKLINIHDSKNICASFSTIKKKTEGFIFEKPVLLLDKSYK